MITDMAKLEIVAPSKYREELVDYLQHSGVLHIETIPEELKDEKATSFKGVELNEEEKDHKNRLETIKHKLDEMVAILPLNKERISDEFVKEECTKYYMKKPDELENLINDLNVKLHELNRQKIELKAQQTSLSMYGKTAKAFIPLMMDIKSNEEKELIGVIIDKKHRLILRLLTNEIEKITNNTGKVLSASVDNNTDVAIIAFDKDYKSQVKKLLFDEGLPELAVPSELMNMSLSQSLAYIMERSKTLPQEIDLIEAQLRSVLRNDGAKILGIRALVNDFISKMEIQSKFAESQYTFMMHGWIPSENLPDIKNKAARIFGNQVVISKIKVSHKDFKKVPILFKNVDFVKPYEVIMNSYPTPKYGTIDATMFISVFFPVFFGFILGDVFYGLCIFGLSWLLKRKLGHIKEIVHVSTILNWMGAWTCFWGLIFLEFLGDFVERMTGWHPLFNRMTQITVLISVTVGIGVFMVFYGLILGYINAKRVDHLKEGYARLHQLSGLICIFLMIVVSGFGLPSFLTYIFLVILLTNVVMLILLEGIIGPIEILSYVGNIFSFARIGAIALSSVVIAFIANEIVVIVGDLLGGVLGGFIAGFIGITISIFFHTLNLVIGIFSPTIHSLRLHFVEFFMKFYQMGGTPYKPFKKFGGE
jgi:V/A-type H+/Na+-transporting ATPase subunit I